MVLWPPELNRLRQEDCQEFKRKRNPGFKVRSYLKK